MLSKSLVLGIVISLLLPVLGLLLFTSTCGDDANITWFAGYSLAEHGEIAGYDGDRVEQSSSLAQVLLIALLNVIGGIRVADAGIGLSLLFAALCVPAAKRIASKLSDHPDAPFWAGLLTVTCYPLAYWSVSGLDATLAAFAFSGLLLCAADYLLNGKGFAQAACFTCLYLLTRPEGFFVWGAALSATWILLLGSEEQRELRKRIFLLLCLTAAFFLSLTVFRYFYFGRLFPEPVYIKAAGLNFFKVKRGIKYILRNLAVPSQTIWVMLSVAFLWTTLRKFLPRRDFRSNVLPLLILNSALGLSAFLVLTGGDWMENGRYLIVIFPASMAMVAAFLLRFGPKAKLLLMGVVVLNMLVCLGVSAWNSRGRPLWAYNNVGLNEGQRSAFSFFQAMSQDGVRDIPVAWALDSVYQRVVKVKQGKVTIMSGQAGLIISHLAQRHPNEFRWIDLWGLSDKTFADCPPTREVQMIPAPSWDYNAYFRLLPEVRKQCAAYVEPDILFELDDVGQHDLFPANGYRIVYHQRGWVDSGDRLFPGMGVNAGEVIAVKNDLADLAGLQEVK